MVTRVFKGEKGAEIWEELVLSFPGNYGYIYPIVDDANTLFHQATDSFDISALDATAILCRATIDALFQGFLTLEWNSKREQLVPHDQLDLGGDFRRIEYSELEVGMRKRKLFSKIEWKHVRRIREDGNYSAHLGSLRRQKEIKLLVEMAKVYSDHRRKALSVEETAESYQELAIKHMTHITVTRARQNLRDTASIYSKIVHAIKAPSPKYST